MSDYSEQRKDSLPSSFYGLLALDQHRLNQAVGVRRVTPQVGLLLELYQRTRQGEEQGLRAELDQLSKKAFYLGVIRGARKRIREIKRQITLGVPLEEAQKLHQEALLLQERIAKAGEAIEK